MESDGFIYLIDMWAMVRPKAPRTPLNKSNLRFCCGPNMFCPCWNAIVSITISWMVYRTAVCSVPVKNCAFLMKTFDNEINKTEIREKKIPRYGWTRGFLISIFCFWSVSSKRFSASFCSSTDFILLVYNLCFIECVLLNIS